MSFLNQQEVILFQGDSVTDCGRNRNDLYHLGGGYPLMIAAALSARPGVDYTFINKGVSGDRVKDLSARWDTDCIRLNPMPTVVSILIGINDTWRRYDNNDPTSASAFEATYRQILTHVQEETGARLILLEPFMLPVQPGQENWREDLDPKIQAARKLAREFNARYVSLDGRFAAAAAQKKPSYWLPDGVHPSTAGHGLIAKAWLEATE